MCAKVHQTFFQTQLSQMTNYQCLSYPSQLSTDMILFCLRLRPVNKVDHPAVVLPSSASAEVYAQDPVKRYR